LVVWAGFGRVRVRASAPVHGFRRRNWATACVSGRRAVLSIYESFPRQLKLVSDLSMTLSPPERRDAMRNAEAKRRLGGTLWARLLALMIFTLLGTGAGCGQTSDPGVKEAVSFQSGSYADLRQVLTREAPISINKVAASLVFPAAAKDRYPAVIFARRGYAVTLAAEKK